MSSNKKLSAVITIGGAVAGSLKSAFGTIDGSLSKLGKTVSDLTKRQKLLGKSIQEFGRAGKDVDGLRASYAKLTTQIERAQKAQQRLRTVQKIGNGSKAIGGAMVGAGASAAIGAASIGAVLFPGIQEAKRQQVEQARIAALGFSKADSDYLIKAATAQKAFGVSTKEATETARDLAAAFGDVHHATSALPLALKQRFALGLYDQEHGTNLAEHAAYSMGKVIELRNGTKNEEEYRRQANMAHQVMVATGGRITGEEMQQAIRTGGIAAKSMTDKAFYYGGSHLMQEMGGDTFGTASMSLYNALAQGHVTKRAANNLEKLGLIADPTKVVSDKAGQVKFLDPGALLGYDTFAKDPQAWVEKYFIPVLKKNGIDPDDMQKVAEVAGSIISNRNGANLLATRVAQRGVIAKEYANAERADTIEQGYDRNRDTTGGKEANLHARLMDAQLRIGTVLLPLYTRALEGAATALEKLNTFTARHPTLTKFMVTGLAALGAALAGTAIALTSVGTAFKLVGSAILFVGRLALTNPVGLIITAIAVGALLIYKYWDPIKGFFKDLWEDVTQSFQKALSFITKGFDWIGEKWRQTKAFLGFGSNSAPLSSGGGNMPALPSFAPARAMQTTKVDVGGINIYQQAGEDSAALAKRVAAEIQKQQGIKQRSIMFDGATQ
jgi:hypothetical protein